MGNSHNTTTPNAKTADNHRPVTTFRYFPSSQVGGTKLQEHFLTYSHKPMFLDQYSIFEHRIKAKSGFSGNIVSVLSVDANGNQPEKYITQPLCSSIKETCIESQFYIRLSIQAIPWRLSYLRDSAKFTQNKPQKLKASTAKSSMYRNYQKKNNLSLMKGLYIFMGSLFGFYQLQSATNKHFTLREGMIGINSEGRVRVWINEDFTKNLIKEQQYPSGQNTVRNYHLRQVQKTPSHDLVTKLFDLLEPSCEEIKQFRTNFEQFYRERLSFSGSRAQPEQKRRIQCIKEFLQHWIQSDSQIKYLFRTHQLGKDIINSLPKHQAFISKSLSKQHSSSRVSHLESANSRKSLKKQEFSVMGSSDFNFSQDTFISHNQLGTKRSQSLALNQHGRKYNPFKIEFNDSISNGNHDQLILVSEVERIYSSKHRNEPITTIAKPFARTLFQSQATDTRPKSLTDDVSKNSLKPIRLKPSFLSKLPLKTPFSPNRHLHNPRGLSPRQFSEKKKSYSQQPSRFNFPTTTYNNPIGRNNRQVSNFRQNVPMKTHRINQKLQNFYNLGAQPSVQWSNVPKPKKIIIAGKQLKNTNALRQKQIINTGPFINQDQQKPLQYKSRNQLGLHLKRVSSKHQPETLQKRISISSAGLSKQSSAGGCGQGCISLETRGKRQIIPLFFGKGRSIISAKQIKIDVLENVIESTEEAFTSSNFRGSNSEWVNDSEANNIENNTCSAGDKFLRNKQDIQPASRQGMGNQPEEEQQGQIDIDCLVEELKLVLRDHNEQPRDLRPSEHQRRTDLPFQIQGEVTTSYVSKESFSSQNQTQNNPVNRRLKNYRSATRKSHLFGPGTQSRLTHSRHSDSISGSCLLKGLGARHIESYAQGEHSSERKQPNQTFISNQQNIKLGPGQNNIKQTGLNKQSCLHTTPIVHILKEKSTNEIIQRHMRNFQIQQRNLLNSSSSEDWQFNSQKVVKDTVNSFMNNLKQKTVLVYSQIPCQSKKSILQDQIIDRNQQKKQKKCVIQISNISVLEYQGQETRNSCLQSRICQHQQKLRDEATVYLKNKEIVTSYYEFDECQGKQFKHHSRNISGAIFDQENGICNSDKNTTPKKRIKFNLNKNDPNEMRSNMQIRDDRVQDSRQNWNFQFDSDKPVKHGMGLFQEKVRGPRQRTKLANGNIAIRLKSTISESPIDVQQEQISYAETCDKEIGLDGQVGFK